MIASCPGMSENGTVSISNNGSLYNYSYSTNAVLDPNNTGACVMETSNYTVSGAFSGNEPASKSVLYDWFSAESLCCNWNNIEIDSSNRIYLSGTLVTGQDVVNAVMVRQ